MKSVLTQYYNCRILWRQKLEWEDLWVRDGVIRDPRSVFFEEKVLPDCRIDCHGLIISPGFIDIQLNGGFEIDFSSQAENLEEGLDKVAKAILQHGVTAFCPTVITSPDDVYKQIIPKIKKTKATDRASILGIHLEGPFISKEKRGAHPAKYIKDLDKGFETLLNTYGNLDHVSIVTLAPETDNCLEVIKTLTEKGIRVSLGHSVASLVEAEVAVNSGASLITHLFNAMHPFHHRDPGLVGLLTSKKIIHHKQIYYGIISDGIHTHPAALRIAYRTNPKGIVLITDAISAMGLDPGTYQLGQQRVNIKGFSARLVDSNILAGSIATMSHCVKHFRKATFSSTEEALEAATLHPAQCLGIEDRKGTLEYGTDADFIILDDDLNIYATFIAGLNVYASPALHEKGVSLCETGA